MASFARYVSASIICTICCGFGADSLTNRSSEGVSGSQKQSVPNFIEMANDARIPATIDTLSVYIFITGTITTIDISICTCRVERVDNVLQGALKTYISLYAFSFINYLTVNYL